MFFIVAHHTSRQRRQFQEFSNPPMVASHWPRLLYPNGLVNRNKPSEGLLQGELLVMVNLFIHPLIVH
jgi:hypothetical protein